MGQDNQGPFFLVLPAGLEPATSWFEAKHSIQLSYESKLIILFMGIIEPSALGSEDRCSVQLRYRRIGTNHKKLGL